MSLIFSGSQVYALAKSVLISVTKCQGISPHPMIQHGLGCDQSEVEDIIEYESTLIFWWHGELDGFASVSWHKYKPTIRTLRSFFLVQAPSSRKLRAINWRSSCIDGYSLVSNKACPEHGKETLGNKWGVINIVINYNIDFIQNTPWRECVIQREKTQHRIKKVDLSKWVHEFQIARIRVAHRFIVNVCRVTTTESEVYLR